MEVLIGAVVALVILAGVHRAPKGRLIIAPRRGVRRRKGGALLGPASSISPRRTAAYWWFREPARGAR